MLVQRSQQRLEVDRVVALLVDRGQLAVEPGIRETVVDQEVRRRDDERLPGVAIVRQRRLQQDVQHAVRGAVVQVQVLWPGPGWGPAVEPEHLVVQELTNLLPHPESAFIRPVR